MTPAHQDHSEDRGTRAAGPPRSLFPVVHPPELAQVLDLEHQIEQFARMPREQQRAKVKTQLGQLVRHAIRYSPYWRERLSPASSEQIGGALSLGSMPILTREILQRDAKAMLIPLAGGESHFRILRSSGSTGVPVEVVRYWPIDGPHYAAISRIDLRWHGTDSARLSAVIKDEPDRSTVDSTETTSHGLRRAPVQVRNMVEHSPSDLLEWLVRVRPAYLVTTPSMAAELARLAVDAGIVLPIEQVRTFAEPVTDHLRQALFEAFGAKVIDRYTSEEFGWIALQCPVHDHLHVMNSNVIVEVINDAGRPCRAGETGRVLVTGLHGYAMPLIRYDIGDVAEVGEQCDCGITLPVLRRIHGRERSFIVHPDGTKRLARLTGEYWRSIAPIDEYRVVQYSDGVIEGFVRASRTLDPGELGALREMLSRVLTFAGEVEVTQVSRMRWPSRWKRTDVLRLDVTREQAIRDHLVPSAESGIK